MTEKKKVLVYVVKDRKLLVFRHVDFPFEKTGLQIPGGSIKEGETPKEAVLRELREETGYSGFKIISFLGNNSYDMSAYKPEMHERFFFLAEPTEALPGRWQSQENHDGLKEPTRFEFYWIPLEEGANLSVGQGAFLAAIK